ncbi:neuronal calcium sensor 1-like [Watersipora subatra]|uniref:neuronal calcium sensor 1-like n=1 Tax=Watersipora subatra TaxID=2589382 RepID=UPI00355BC6D3
MGKCTSAIRKVAAATVPGRVVAKLREHGLDLSVNEIHHWFHLFTEEFAHGEIVASEMRKIIRSYHPTRDEDALFKGFLNEFSLPGEEIVNFLAFMKALAKISSVSCDVKRIPFALLDTDNDGIITKQDAKVMMKRHFKLMGVAVDASYAANTYVESLYSNYECDTMSQEEFIHRRSNTSNWQTEYVYMVIGGVFNQLQPIPPVNHDDD